MPITEFQRRILAALAPSRSSSSYLAGGTALHFAPDSTRYSRDVDLFHDLEEQVADAFARDRDLLNAESYRLDVLISQPGFIRAVVKTDHEATQIDWARESAWRFMPLVQDDLGGFLLHEIDLATNKILALAGRDEPRDFVDTLFVMDRVLPLGPLVWAASAKDLGYSPLSLLEQIKRRGRYRPEDFSRLDLVRPLDLVSAKSRWLGALTDAERFINSRASDEAGCLYYSADSDRFVEPKAETDLGLQRLSCHFGRLGGVLPKPTDQSVR